MVYSIARVHLPSWVGKQAELEAAVIAACSAEVRCRSAGDSPTGRVGDGVVRAVPL